MGENVTINCKTSDNRAASTLWVRKDINPARQIVPNGRTITQRGNRFYFNRLTLNDAGLYMCKATSSRIKKTIEEEITSLLVFAGNLVLCKGQDCVY